MDIFVLPDSNEEERRWEENMVFGNSKKNLTLLYFNLMIIFPQGSSTVVPLLWRMSLLLSYIGSFMSICMCVCSIFYS